MDTQPNGEFAPEPLQVEDGAHRIAPSPTTAAAPPHRRRRRLLWVGLASGLAALILAGAGGVYAERSEGSGQAVAASAPIATSPQNPSSGAGTTDPKTVAGQVSASVVDINTVFQSGTQSGQAAGTGMIVSSNGEVLTNNHVIQGATQIEVTIPGRSGTYTATVAGTDPSADVALIQIQGVSGLPTVTFANSSTLTTGEPVIAIGNALGRGGSPSVTSGTITALDESITATDSSGAGSEQLSGMIESDASILPGDSGGPLVNQSGQVVGMITAGQSTGHRQMAATTAGFAIPSSTAVDIVNQIRSGQASPSILLGQTPYIGVEVTDLNQAATSQLGTSATSGALVVGVVPGSPAASLALAPNAVITSAGGKTIDLASTLGSVLHSYKVGQSVTLTWVDNYGTTHSGTVTLAAGPAA